MRTLEEAKSRLDEIIGKFANWRWDEYRFSSLADVFEERAPAPTYEETEEVLGLAAQLNARLTDDFMRIAQQNRYNNLDAAKVLQYKLGPCERTDFDISENFFDKEITENNARGRGKTA